MREIRGGVFQGRFHNLLISKNNTFWAPQISRITFQVVMKSYPAEFKERAVKLAVELEQPIAQTARDLGVNENTLHTWIGKYHRVESQEKQVNDEHLYEELKRLRKENARLKEERDILKKAAAYFAQQLP